MNPVTVIRARGAIPKIDEVGNLTLDLSRVPQSLRAEVVELARQHKPAIINELLRWAAGDPSPVSDDWQCPSGYARHREYWTSAYGLKICTICHPGPCKGGSTWKQ